MLTIIITKVISLYYYILVLLIYRVGEDHGKYLGISFKRCPPTVSQFILSFLLSEDGGESHVTGKVLEDAEWGSFWGEAEVRIITEVQMLAVLYRLPFFTSILSLHNHRGHREKTIETHLVILPHSPSSTKQV